MLMSTVYGPKWPFLHMLCIILNFLGQVCSSVELLVQRRLCPIFVRDVGSPDIHECFRGLTGSQRTPRFWGVTSSTSPSALLLILSSTAPSSYAVCILLSLFPSLFITASSFAYMAIILSCPIRPFPLNLLLLPEASDGAL